MAWVSASVSLPAGPPATVTRARRDPPSHNTRATIATNQIMIISRILKREDNSCTEAPKNESESIN
jgi:hypothetical protein